MARLPQPGADDGQWGTILNSYLTIAHNTDGTLKDGVVGATKLAAGAPANGQVLSYNGSGLAWAAPVAGGAGKADDNAVVHLTGNETIAGIKNFTGTLQAGGTSVVVTDDPRMNNTRVPNDGSVTVNKLSAGSGSNGQILGYDNGNLVWTTVTADGAISDAAPGTKGIIALSGDLAGTAGTPTVPGLATKADNATVVHLATAENITGVKTFSVSPIVPTPTTASQAVTKAYVDAAVGAGGAAATSSTLGTLQLAGDLSGPATAPVIATGVITEAKLAAAVQTKLNAGGGAVTSVAGKTGVVTLTKADVGLTNVDNTTDANKPISTATQTALSGKAATAHTHAAADITTGTVATARLGSGTANSTTYLRGDGQWATPAGGGSGNGYVFTLRNITDQAAITAAAFDVIIVRSVATGKLTVTLPAAVLNSTVRIKRMAPTGNSVEVAAPGGTYIDAPAVGTHMLNTMYDSQDFWSDGLNWYRV